MRVDKIMMLGLWLCLLGSCLLGSWKNQFVTSLIACMLSSSKPGQSLIAKPSFAIFVTRKQAHDHRQEWKDLVLLIFWEMNCHFQNYQSMVVALLGKLLMNSNWFFNFVKKGKGLPFLLVCYFLAWLHCSLKFGKISIVQ